MRSLPDDVLDFYGNYRWWERAGVLSNPQASAFVPDLDAAKSALKILYDDDTCKRLVLAGHGHMVIGLFFADGWMPSVDEILQLGADLALCRGWESRSRLVAALRSPHGFDGARFEVGFWAGLVRRRLPPIVEPATRPDKKRPDFVVDFGATRVAIELKTLSDPLSDLNSDVVYHALHHLAQRSVRDNWRGDIHLVLSEEARTWLGARRKQFAERHLPTIEAEIANGLRRMRLNSVIALPTIGQMVITYPRWEFSGEGYWFGAVVETGIDITPRQTITRALAKVTEASRQLAEVTTDVRIAVVWGSRTWLRAAWAAHNAPIMMNEEVEKWRVAAVDWVAFVNCRTLGRSGHCEVDVEPCAIPGSRAPIPPVIIEALRSWGPRFRGCVVAPASSCADAIGSLP